MVMAGTTGTIGTLSTFGEKNLSKLFKRKYVAKIVNPKAVADPMVASVFQSNVYFLPSVCMAFLNFWERYDRKKGKILKPCLSV